MEMSDEQAYKFLELYELFHFCETGVKITDLDPATGEVEIQTPAPNGKRFWADKWTAAKVIAAHSS